MIHTAHEIPIFFDALTLPPETACLPEQDSEEDLGRECFIAGWGLKNQQGDTATNLQEAGVPILDHQTCVNWYRYDSLDFSNDSNQKRIRSVISRETVVPLCRIFAWRDRQLQRRQWRTFDMRGKQQTSAERSYFLGNW